MTRAYKARIFGHTLGVNTPFGVLWIVPAVAALLAGCGRDTQAPVETVSPPENMAPLRGKAEYERACASCHDEGTGEAPAIGDREAWAARSPLWEAVLYEHATQGFLDMPAMGGAEDLTESDVEAAAEYMLSITYPERPPDPQ